MVDNASTDGAVQAVKKTYPQVIVLQNKENVGFGKANNQAIRISKGEAILLLNSDTKVTEGAVDALYKFVQNHPRSVVGPKLLNLDGSEQTSCGPFFTLPVVFLMLFCKGDALELTRWSPVEVTKVGWVSGACLMASKELFLDGLLFDEKIFMYMDEIDLLYRAKKKGYTVYFMPEASVYHVGSGSSKDKRKTPILNIYKGLMAFYQKHYASWELPILKGMLQSKARIGMWYGSVFRKKDVQETYEEALTLVQ
jgi:hypothetical protein